MKIRTIGSMLALCAPTLLQSCMLRWDPSSEKDQNPFEPREGSDVYGAYGGRVDPGTPRVREREPAPPLTTESDQAAIDAVESAPTDLYRELIVLDPGVLAALSADDDRAPFSFRSQMQWLAGNADALELTRAWLLEWQTASEVGPELAPVAPRPLVGRLLVDPWVAASTPSGRVEIARASADTETASAAYSTPETEEAAPEDAAEEAPEDTPEEPAEDDGYAPAEPPEYLTPPAEETPPLPSWQGAPFRLIAIVNRLDLADDACDGAAGELRYIYGALDADGSTPLDVTLILEVPYPTTRSAAEWARAWKDLGALRSGDEYTRALAALGSEIMADSDPLRARIRTNEIAFADADSGGWEMREFRPQIVEDTLALVQAPLEFTPRADADPAELSAYVLEHADEIESSGASLPEPLRAGAASIDTPDFSWNVLGVSERLRRAFSLQTCNGCHGGDTASLPFRHISPGESLGEPARLSRFLYDPDEPSDELRRRLDIVDALGETDCAPPEPTDDVGYGG
jgi:hypothetical protein